MTAAKTYTAYGSQTVPAGTTKASPVSSPTVDLSAPGQTATLTASLQNGASAPTAVCILVAQTSGDGSAWRDHVPVSGDLLANSQYSWTVRIPPEAKFARWIAFNNASNPVTVTFESTVYSPS